MGNSPAFNWNQFPSAGETSKQNTPPAGGFNWNAFPAATAESSSAALAPPSGGNPSTGFDFSQHPIAGTSPAASGGFDFSQHPKTEAPPSTWLGKSWDFLNKPLLNLHREGATGVEAGAEEFASGLTSPLNVALTIGTMGAGPLLESLGVKLAGEAAIPVIKTVGRLAKAGFTGQMVYGLAQEYPQFQVALKNGDTDRALEVGTKLALGGALAFHGAREVAKDVGLVDSKSRANTGVDEARGQREATAQSVYQEARETRAAVMENVKNEVRRGAVQLFAEAGGDAAKLTEWKAKLDAATDVDPKLQRQVSSLLDVAQNLKPAEVEVV